MLKSAPRISTCTTLIGTIIFLLQANNLLSAETANPEQPSVITDFYAWIQNIGWPGIIAFSITYITATIIFIPGAILTIGAGLLFGVVKGSIIVSISSIIGASLAFAISRHFLRDYIFNKFSKNPKFKAIDKAIGKEGSKIIFLLRLSPVMPFNLSNYLYGITAIDFKSYFWASWTGMLPATIMYVYIGSLGKTTAESLNGTAETGKIVLNIVAFIATVAVTIYITKLSKKALAEANLDTEPS